MKENKELGIWCTMIKGHMRMGIWVFVFLMIFSVPAYAIRCKDWKGLDTDQKKQTLKEISTELLNSPKAENWTSINITKIKRCLNDSITTIEEDFDEACSKGTKAAIGILDEILLDHARGCAAKT